MHASIRRRLAVLAAVASLAAGYHAVSAPAIATTDPSAAPVSCYFEEHIITSPRPSLEPGEYSYVSDGPATTRCVGMIDGQPITGPGWFVDFGTGSGTIVEASGHSHFTGALPVAGGEVAIDGFLHLHRVGLSGEFHGFMNDAFYVGTYAGAPSPATLGLPSSHPDSTAMVYGDAVLVVGSDAVTPAQPHSVATKVRGDRVTVSWQGRDEPGRPQITGFHVYRNSKRVATVDADARSFVDDAVTHGTYTYRVEATSDRYESDHGGPVTAVVRYSGP